MSSDGGGGEGGGGSGGNGDIYATVSSSSSSSGPEFRAASSVSPTEEEDTIEGQLDTLQEKLKRTTKFLHEIQNITPACEEAKEDIKERQLLVRRILQVSTELQDARDLLYSLCRPPRLTPRQFELVTAATAPTAAEAALEDPAHDPSVRFFGLDWQQLYSRCFSLSLNLQVLRTQALAVASSQEDARQQGAASASSATPSVSMDLVLLTTILRDMSRIEVDVTSHGEAVLHGRLSKSQQRLIQREQNKFSQLTPMPRAVTTNVTKSRSFRDTNGQRRQQRYRKNRTTDLHKLSLPSSHSAANVMVVGHNNREDMSEEWQEVLAEDQRQQQQQQHQGHGHGQQQPKRKTSFIQNVSAIFKNIR